MSINLSELNQTDTTHIIHKNFHNVFKVSFNEPIQVFNEFIYRLSLLYHKNTQIISKYVYIFLVFNKKKYNHNYI